MSFDGAFIDVPDKDYLLLRSLVNYANSDKSVRFVLDRLGKPISGALLDFWHADAEGQYDLETFRCRGH